MLLPVTIIVGSAGFAGFFYTRSYLLEQWSLSTQFKLEDAAHKISMKLDEKLQLINLISKAEDVPEGGLTQAFLIQQLTEKDGVRFVEIDLPGASTDPSVQSGIDPNDYAAGVVDGLYTMELCGDLGFCAPIMDPGALDRSLRIVKVLGFSRFKVYAKRRDGFRTLAVLTCQTRHEVERFVSDIGSAIPRKCTIKL